MPQQRGNRRFARQQHTPYGRGGPGGGRGQPGGRGGGRTGGRYGGGDDRQNPYPRNNNDRGGGRKFTQNTGAGKKDQLEEMSKALWKAFLEKRWNGEQCMLDLTGMVADETLKAVKNQTDLNIAPSCYRLCEILHDEFVHRGLRTLNLSNNGIKLLYPWAQAMAKFDLPIQNLCFANNLITKVDELRALSKLKLREAIFTGNPIQANPQTYNPAVMKFLRKLEWVDGSQLPHSKQPAPVKDSYVDSQESLSLVGEIFNKWVHAAGNNLWDNAIELYAPKCFFSLTISDSKGNRDDLGLLARVPVPIQPFRNEVQALDCNVRKFGKMLTSQNNPSKLRMSHGRIDVVNALKALFSAGGKLKCEHDMESIKVDCLVQGGLLIATIHGRLAVIGDQKKGAAVTSSNTMRMCFDRTWIITPDKRIMNDMLTLRKLTDQPIITPAAQGQ